MVFPLHEDRHSAGRSAVVRTARVVAIFRAILLVEQECSCRYVRNHPDIMIRQEDGRLDGVVVIGHAGEKVRSESCGRIHLFQACVRRRDDLQQPTGACGRLRVVVRESAVDGENGVDLFHEVYRRLLGEATVVDVLDQRQLLNHLPRDTLVHKRLPVGKRTHFALRQVLVGPKDQLVQVSLTVTAHRGRVQKVVVRSVHNLLIRLRRTDDTPERVHLVACRRVHHELGVDAVGLPVPRVAGQGKA